MGLGIDCDTLAQDWGVFLRGFRVLSSPTDVLHELIRLVQHYSVKGKQIHDAGIVATMLVHGIKRVATRNVADFQRYASEITILPVG